MSKAWPWLFNPPKWGEIDFLFYKNCPIIDNLLWTPELRKNHFTCRYMNLKDASQEWNAGTPECQEECYRWSGLFCSQGGQAESEGWGGTPSSLGAGCLSSPHKWSYRLDTANSHPEETRPEESDWKPLLVMIFPPNSKGNHSLSTRRSEKHPNKELTSGPLLVFLGSLGHFYAGAKFHKHPPC